MIESDMAEKIGEKWNRFVDWQKEPVCVAPMSEEQHVCNTCGTEYQGNFCPRCGQSHKVEQRMTLWKTFLLFLDVWGIGNRGMFRTVRDLVLRPGYLICDYIRGKRSAYFPPFKMLFLLTTLSLLIDHGWNLKRENYQENFVMEESEIQTTFSDDEILANFMRYVNDVGIFQNDYPALSRLGYTIFLSFFFFGLFRKTKTLGKLRYHEFVIAMVYMVNMANIYTITLRFFGANGLIVALPTLLYLIPLKQITGYGWWKTVWRSLVSILGALIFLSALIIGGLILVYAIQSK